MSNVAQETVAERVKYQRKPKQVPDIGTLPAWVPLTTSELSLITRSPEVTIKSWRVAEPPRGPKVTWLDDRPRYLVGDVRAWLGLDASSHGKVA